MSSKTTTNEIINSLAKSMVTSPKTILYLIGLTNSSLSMIVHKPFAEIAKTKIGQRIIKLAATREFLIKEHAADKYEIVYCFTAPAYRNAKNALMDFSTALQKDIYPKEQLQYISLTALKVCRGESRVPAGKKTLIPKDIQKDFDKAWELCKESLLEMAESVQAKEEIKKNAMAIFMAGLMSYENSPSEEPKSSFKDKEKITEITDKYRQWWDKSSNKDPNPQTSFVAGYTIGRIDGMHEAEEREKDELV